MVKVWCTRSACDLYIYIKRKFKAYPLTRFDATTLQESSYNWALVTTTTIRI